MTTKKIFTAAVVLVLATVLFSSVGFAACDTACNSGSQYSCSLTTTTMAKSTSGTLTVAITNQQAQSASNLATTLQDLGWFTGTTTTSTISSLQASASTSIDYTITPTSDGAQSVCVRMGSTCTADCGSITITSPASLSITSLTTSASSVSTSGSFTASATIYNSGTETAGSTTAITATLSSSSGCTVSGATKTVGTLVGKESNSQSWTLTAGSSAATCTLTLSASGSAGGSDSETATVTVTAASSSNASSSSSSSGSSASSNATTSKETKAFSTSAGVSKLVTFTQQSATGLTDIELKTAAAKTGVQISASSGSKPSGAPDPAAGGTVYSYIELTKTNVTDADLSLVKIKFRVPKSWAASNNIDPLKVSLYRYTSSWDKLLTTQTSADATYYYYEAVSPGLSTFAVAGEKIVAATPAAPVLTIVSPAAGASVVGTTVDVVLSASGVRLAAPNGSAVEGEGHFHVWIDDGNEQRGAKTTFTFENVAPGQHTVRAELHKGDHSLYLDTTKTVTFTLTVPAEETAEETTAETTEQPAPPDATTLIGIVVLILAVGFGVVHHYMIKGKKKYDYRPVRQVYEYKHNKK